MRSYLKTILPSLESVEYGELRYQKRTSRVFCITQGELTQLEDDYYGGVGIRVLNRGGWGFSSSSRVDEPSIKQSITNAKLAASITASSEKPRRLAPTQPIQGRFAPQISDPLAAHGNEEIIALCLNTFQKLKQASPLLTYIRVKYLENLVEKVLVTTEGTEIEIQETNPEFIISVVGMDGTNKVTVSDMVGITGDWADLWEKRPLEKYLENIIKKTELLLGAGYVTGERTTVILDPGVAGLIAHEAIGHTVEADFVQAGSVAAGKIGIRVADERVSLSDSGNAEIKPFAAGTIPIDDEGVPTQNTAIIKNGILCSYLHDRESAALFGVEPTGNARAYDYNDEPLIRMRNTYIHPGEEDFEALVEGVDHGYLLRDARAGEADSNGEFMFNIQLAYRIEKGKIVQPYRELTVSGQAFDVLSSVDGISKDFKWDMGAGFCGKGQIAKVDGGGGYVRCNAIVGGQE